MHGLSSGKLFTHITNRAGGWVIALRLDAHRAEFSSSMTLKERAPLVATTAPRPGGLRAGAPPLAVLTPRRASTQDRHTRGSHRCRYATGGTQREGHRRALRAASRVSQLLFTLILMYSPLGHTGLSWRRG